VVVAAGFIQCAEVSKTGSGPELPAAFEPDLLLAAGRFYGSRADGPSSPGDLLIIHPTGMGFKS